jgi:hypothetical protein
VQTPKWTPADEASEKPPRLEAMYQPFPDDATSKETLPLPPKKFPLLGNLNPKLASEVRGSITTAAVQKQIATEAKLAECEQQKKKLSVAAEAVRELRKDGDSRLEQVMAMMRRLNGLEPEELDREIEKKGGSSGSGGQAVVTPPSTEKPLRASQSAAAAAGAAAGRVRPPVRRMQAKAAVGRAGKKPGGPLAIIRKK